MKFLVTNHIACMRKNYGEVRMVVTWKKLMAAIERDPAFKERAATPEQLTSEKSKATADVERLFQFVGAYVVVFQDIEAKLDQIIQLAVGHERWHVSHGVTAHLSNSQKIDLVHSIVHASAIASGNEFQKEWVTSFDEIVQRLKTEGTRRNKIVHSLYIFDFMEAGGPPLRSKRKRGKGDVNLDQEWVDDACISQATGELYQLSFDLGMALTQLRHWAEPLGCMKAKEK
jgi:hypothetical protein